LLRGFSSGASGKISSGGIRLHHPSHDHFDPFSIETEAHWTGLWEKNRKAPYFAINPLM
jgi:hypothetical protein